MDCPTKNQLTEFKHLVAELRPDARRTLTELPTFASAVEQGKYDEALALLMLTGFDFPHQPSGW